MLTTFLHLFVFLNNSNNGSNCWAEGCQEKGHKEVGQEEKSPKYKLLLLAFTL